MTSTTDRNRIIKTLADLIAVPTISEGPHDVRSLMDKCDYARFGEVLKAEADLRGLIFEKIGIREGNFLIKRKDEDPAKQILLLVSHCDTVPVESMEEWFRIKKHPFNAVVEGDLVWGRGSNDDKSGIVIGLEAISRIKNPKMNVRMIVARDEEIGSELGYVYLAKNGFLNDYHASLVLDSGPEIKVASSGAVWLFISSISHPLKIFDALMKYNEELKNSGSSYVAAEPKGKPLWGRLSITVINAFFPKSKLFQIRGGMKTNQIPENCVIKFDDDAFALIKSALNPGFMLEQKDGFANIMGLPGHAAYPHLAKNPVEEALRIAGKLGINVAEDCTMQVDVRTIPEEDEKQTINRLMSIINNADPKCMVSVNIRAKSTNSLKSERDSEFVNQVSRAFSVNSLDSNLYADLGGSDAGIIAELGIPVVSMGALSSKLGMHTDNEHVSLTTIDKMISVVISLVGK